MIYLRRGWSDLQIRKCMLSCLFGTAFLVLVAVCAILSASSPLTDGDTMADELRDQLAGIRVVHIVPHSHNDVGWLKTVDQYFYGEKNSI